MRHFFNLKPLSALRIFSIVFIASLFVISCANDDSSTDDSDSVETKKEPEFVKDGILTFQLGDTLKKIIDIEVVDKEEEITKGLMFRSKMEEHQGMLFVFPDSQPRSFWMKNTVISLDIIFISEDKKVVSIQKYATPFSEESLPSEGSAKYVLEVVAGFCDKYGVEPGTPLTF